MKLRLKCDLCGKFGDSDAIFTGYDDIDRCLECGIKGDLSFLERDYKDSKEWLENTFLKRLRETKEEIKELRAKLKLLKAKQSKD